MLNTAGFVLWYFVTGTAYAMGMESDTLPVVFREQADCEQVAARLRETLSRGDHSRLFISTLCVQNKGGKVS